MILVAFLFLNKLYIYLQLHMQNLLYYALRLATCLLLFNIYVAFSAKYERDVKNLLLMMKNTNAVNIGMQAYFSDWYTEIS